jgi:hypothetical protein
MHEEADLLHGKADVRSSECQILKCSSKTMTFGGIRKWFAIGYGRFRLGVDRCNTWVAIKHGCTIKEIPGILCLRKNETIFVAVNRNAKEMLKGTKITHGKLGLKLVDEFLQKCGGIGCENYVIDIHE